MIQSSKSRSGFSRALNARTTPRQSASVGGGKFIVATCSTGRMAGLHKFARFSAIAESRGAKRSVDAAPQVLMVNSVGRNHFAGTDHFGEDLINFLHSVELARSVRLKYFHGEDLK